MKQGTKKGRAKTEKRAKGRLSVHPLFLLLGVCYAFTGELFAFFLSTVVAIQHECAHAFAAARLGYKLDRVILMPYGAVIDGDLEGISVRDEIFVAACGPLCNLVTAAGFFALWWLFPSAYAYTDAACFVSLSVALVNLVPAYPLDGGRVLKCVLEKRLEEKRAERVCRTVSLLFAGGCFAAFAFLLFRGEVNLSLPLFGVFLAAGAFGSGKGEARYTHVDFSSRRAFARGAEIKKVAALSDCTVKRAISFTERGRFLVLDVYDKRENFLGELTQNDLAEIFSEGGLYAKIGDFQDKFR